MSIQPVRNRPAPITCFEWCEEKENGHDQESCREEQCCRTLSLGTVLSLGAEPEIEEDGVYVDELTVYGWTPYMGPVQVHLASSLSAFVDVLTASEARQMWRKIERIFRESESEPYAGAFIRIRPTSRKGSELDLTEDEARSLWSNLGEVLCMIGK